MTPLAAVPGQAWTLTPSSSLVLHLARGLAAQAVVVGHGLSFFGITQRFDIIQNSAVAVFFVLSGFVIPYSSFSKASRDPRYGFANFFIDRFSRIYMGLVPALVFVVAIDLLSQALFGSRYRYSGAFDAATLAASLLMLQEWPLAPVFTSFGSARPLWTIAVEWWIYLAFGWIALRHRWRQERPAAWWMGAAVLAVVPAFNWASGRGQGLTMMWLMGTLIFALLDRAPALSRRAAWMLTSLLLGLAAWRLSLTGTAYDTVYVGLLASALYTILSVTQRGEMQYPAPLARATIFNADFSYTLYLVHYSILDILALWLGVGVVGLAVGFVASNVVAVVLYLAFERHYRRLAAFMTARLAAVTARPEREVLA